MAWGHSGGKTISIYGGIRLKFMNTSEIGLFPTGQLVRTPPTKNGHPTIYQPWRKTVEVYGSTKRI